MKRILGGLVVGVALLGVGACKPVVVEPPPATQSVTLALNCQPAPYPCPGTATATVVDSTGGRSALTFGEFATGADRTYTLLLVPGTALSITVSDLDPAYTLVWGDACEAVAVDRTCVISVPDADVSVRASGMIEP